MQLPGITSKLSHRHFRSILKAGAVLTILGWLVYSCVPVPEQEYSSSRWQNSGATIRGAMVRDLIARQTLIGKTENQIIEILGKPDGVVSEQNCLTYAIKPNLRCSLVWNCDLLVYLDKQTRTVIAVAKTD
ncbi:MAG: hypothetical protein U0Z53_01540 [Blastocatellia bacterium]